MFLVADGDHAIAATTALEPTVGLVFYDLKRCLDGLGEESRACHGEAEAAAGQADDDRPDDEEEGRCEAVA